MTALSAAPLRQRGGARAPWWGLLARLVVGGVWIWAGAHKLFDPASSIAAVRAYEILPADLVEPVAYLLPALEVVVGATLVVGLLTRGAALLSAVLLVAFIVGVASAWARGLEIDCGCFGDGGANPEATSQYPWEIARDVALLALSLLLLRLRSTRLALDSVLFRPATVPAPSEGLST